MEAILLVLLLLAVPAVYLRSLAYGPFYLDDPIYLTDNKQVTQGITLEGFLAAFGSTLSTWNPLVFLSYMLECELFGHRVWLHRLVGILLHLANVTLLHALLRRATGRWAPSLLAAALFGLHPLQVEAVVWITARKDTLSMFFALLTLHAYLRYAQGSRWRWYAGCVVAYALALMSKASVVVLPPMLLLLDLWPLRRLPGFRDEVPREEEAGGERSLIAARGSDASPRFAPVSWGRAALEKLPLLVMALAVIPLNAAEAVIISPRNLAEALFQPSYAYLHYLTQFVAPTRLAVAYPHWTTVPVAWNLAALGVVLAGSALAVGRLRKTPALFVGWFWLLGGLLPVVGPLRNNPELHADRFFYLTGVGLITALAFTLADAAAGTWERLGPGRVAALAAAAMLTLGGAACWQVGHWRTNSAMFRRAVALAGERAGALMAPRLAGSFHADGRNLLELGRYPEAAEAFRSAVEFGATDISVHAGLVECHTRLGERDRALREFEQLLKLRPATADDHLQLGLAAFAVGRLDEAITGFTEATRLRPNWSDGYNNLGIALASRGRLQEARDAFARAVQLDPGKPGFLDNLRRAEAMLSGGR